MGLYGFDYNMNMEERDARLLAPDWMDADSAENYTSRKIYSVRRFSNMDIETLEWMVGNKFADPQMRQGNSPDISRFISFMKEYPMFKAEGYVKHNRAADYRLTVEGIVYDGDEQLPPSAHAAFVRFGRGADEFSYSGNDGDDPSYKRAWWD